MNAFCFTFDIPNPYSGRPERRLFSVTPSGMVGPYSTFCEPHGTLPPRDPLPPPLSGIPGTANLAATERARLADKISECWSVDASAPGMSQIIVELVIEVDERGFVRTVRSHGSMPSERRARSVYEAARRALLDPRCNPLPLSRERLATLRHTVFRFRPSDLGLR